MLQGDFYTTVMERFFKNKTFAIVLSLFAMLLWESAIPLIKSTYITLNIQMDDTGAKILIAGIRFFLAGLIAFFYLTTLNKEKIILKDINFKFILFLPFIQITVQYIFYYIGVSNTAGVKSAILQASNAFFVVIISRVLMKEEKITLNKVLALVIGTLGIVIVNSKQGSSFSMTLRGEGAVLIATIVNALCTVLVRKHGRSQNPFLLNTVQFILGSIPLLIIGYVMHYSPLIFNVSAILMLVYGGFISATSFTIWTIVLRYHSSGEFGIYKLFVPIFGSLLSIIILGEEFTLRLLIGMVFVIVGSYILNMKKKLGKT
ncbi:DMT family transporter [Treponema phagedenis]|uniref:DMT family transporter n=2 Tax=Treponema phagedenis TaxID=162 RepID=UPI003138990E